MLQISLAEETPSSSSNSFDMYLKYMVKSADTSNITRPDCYIDPHSPDNTSDMTG